MAATTVFLADLHLEPEDTEAARVFDAFLESLAPGTRVYVLGDLFGYWFEYGAAVFTDFFDVLFALRKAVLRGVTVNLIHGNRDFMMGAFFETHIGARVLGDSAEIELDGKKVLLMHGDLLCTKDRSYLIYRKIIRSRAIRLLTALMPPFFCHWLIGLLRKTTRRTVAKKPHEVFAVQENEVRARLQGHDVLVFGHLHHKSQTSVEAAQAIGLDAWGVSHEHLVYEDGEFRFEQFGT